MSLVVNPYAYFTDTNGDALNGYLYIGEAGKNAENYPIAIYYDGDLTIPAPNPLTINAGYVYNSGTIAQIYASEDYSVVARKTDGSLVFSKSETYGMINGAVATVEDLKGAIAPYNNYALNVLGYSTIGDGGGGLFYYDANSTEDDNGGTIIEPTSGSGRWKRSYDYVLLEYFGVESPDYVLDSNWTWDATVDKSTANLGTIIDPSVALDEQGTGSGLGCMIRQYSGAVNVKWFGAVGNGTADDTEAIRNTINYVISNPLSVDVDSSFHKIFIPHGNYKITSSIKIYPGIHFFGESVMGTQITTTCLDRTFYTENTSPSGSNIKYIIFKYITFRDPLSRSSMQTIIDIDWSIVGTSFEDLLFVGGNIAIKVGAGDFKAKDIWGYGQRSNVFNMVSDSIGTIWLNNFYVEQTGTDGSRTSYDGYDGTGIYIENTGSSPNSVIINNVHAEVLNTAVHLKNLDKGNSVSNIVASNVSAHPTRGSVLYLENSYCDVSNIKMQWGGRFAYLINRGNYFLDATQSDSRLWCKSYNPTNGVSYNSKYSTTRSITSIGVNNNYSSPHSIEPNKGYLLNNFNWYLSLNNFDNKTYKIRFEKYYANTSGSYSVLSSDFEFVASYNGAYAIPEYCKVIMTRIEADQIGACFKIDIKACTTYSVVGITSLAVQLISDYV